MAIVSYMSKYNVLNDTMALKYYDVEFWMYSGKKDDYDNHSTQVKAISDVHAKNITKKRYPRAKNIKTRLIAQYG